jgi:hypothetical protein
MRENHKNFWKDFFWKFLDQAGLAPTILVSTGVARPSEQWRTLHCSHATWTVVDTVGEEEGSWPGGAGGSRWCWWLFLVVLLLVDRVADGLMVTCYDGWNDREREREWGWQKLGVGGWFFGRFWTQNFSTSRPWKSNLFIGDGRGTLCLFWYRISNLGSTRKNPNHWFKVAMMNCQFCAWKWLVGLATLGQCHCLCSLDQPKLLTLSCSQVSGDRLHASFI